MIHPILAKDFVNEAHEKYGQEVWIVGRVVKGYKKAILSTDLQIYSISKSFLS